MKIRSIEIQFCDEVELPAGFEQALDGLLTMVCRAYEASHPACVMWPAGSGAKPLWQEPLEPEFDSSVYFVDVSAREATPRELERRQRVANRRVTDAE